MRFIPKRIQNQDVQPLQVAASSHRESGSHPCNRPTHRRENPAPATCRARAGSAVTRSPSTSISTPGAIRDELELGNEPRRPLLGSGPKRITEDAPDRLLGVLLAINRHRPTDPAGKLSGVVEPEQVVGMSVRERDRMDQPHRSRARAGSASRASCRSADCRRETTAKRWAVCVRFRGSVEVQTEQSQPIMGTPLDVPVPRKISRRPVASSRSVNRPILRHRCLPRPFHPQSCCNIRSLNITKFVITFRAILWNVYQFRPFLPPSDPPANPHSHRNRHDRPAKTAPSCALRAV